MSISEHDLELLETLLDGELPDEQAHALRQRMAADSELAHAMEQVRSDRTMRQQIWRSLEPQEAEVATLVSSVRRAVTRDEVWARRNRALRYVSGLAACILLGFLFGRYVPYGPMNTDESGVLIQSSPGPMTQVVDNTRLGPFRVLLTDSGGRVIAEQHFSSLDEAQEFTEDLRRLQAPNRQRPMRVSDTIFTKDQF